MREDNLKDFIRQYRSDESHFDKIYTAIKEEDGFLSHHPEVKQKAEEYITAKENRPEAWPEFEKFITEVERSMIKE